MKVSCYLLFFFFALAAVGHIGSARRPLQQISSSLTLHLNNLKKVVEEAKDLDPDAKKASLLTVTHGLNRLLHQYPNDTGIRREVLSLCQQLMKEDCIWQYLEQRDGTSAQKLLKKYEETQDQQYLKAASDFPWTRSGQESIRMMGDSFFLEKQFRSATEFYDLLSGFKQNLDADEKAKRLLAHANIHSDERPKLSKETVVFTVHRLGWRDPSGRIWGKMIKGRNSNRGDAHVMTWRDAKICCEGPKGPRTRIIRDDPTFPAACPFGVGGFRLPRKNDFKQYMIYFNHIRHDPKQPQPDDFRYREPSYTAYRSFRNGQPADPQHMPGWESELCFWTDTHPPNEPEKAYSFFRGDPAGAFHAWGPEMMNFGVRCVTDDVGPLSNPPISSRP